MIIETTSRKSMERDLTKYLDITTEELYQYIDYAAEKAKDGLGFNTDIFEYEIASIVCDLQPIKHIDSVMCFHLSRRLNSSLNDDLRSYNLKDLLLTDNPVSNFFADHSILFKEQDKHIDIYYHGRKVKLENTTESDVCYLRSRLGYNTGREDYCFNGFAMRDLLMKNPYAKELYYGPEFLVVLSRFLKDESLVDEFFKQSTYFCYTLKIPLIEIIFDGYDELSNEEKELFIVWQICYRLLKYKESGSKYLFDHDNPIIRAGDNIVLPASYIIDKEIITQEMIK